MQRPARLDALTAGGADRLSFEQVPGPIGPDRAGALSIHAGVEVSGLLHRQTAPGGISAGARGVWSCIDEHRRIVWLTTVPAGHPKQTE